VIDEDIHLAITDFTTDTIRGYTVIKFVPKINGQTHITLDLLSMAIDSIVCNGQVVSYSYNDTLLVAGLPGAFNTTDTLLSKVYYHGKPQIDPSGWGGFSFSSGYAYNIGVGFSPGFHNFGRCWFPCFDNFQEKCTFTFNIISPAGKRAVCNGVLLKDSTATNNLNYRTWRLDKPITSYLASVAVNNYAHVNQTFTGINGNVPVILAAVPGDTTILKNSFVHLENAFDCFESHYGPFAWPRVGYVVVPFSAGAMEHATNIAYPRAFVNGATTYEDVLMAHELSHHWWGDLLTCETAQEMYINEGFASYNQSLFNECVYGEAKYKSKVLDNHDDALHNAHLSDKGFYALSNVPLEYTYGDHSYNKGADMVYNLRTYMGDSLFFAGMKHVLQQRSFKSLNSVMFDTMLTNYTGFNTSDYFNNWIEHPGWAHFSIDSMRVNGNTATVFVRQRLFGATTLYNNVPLELVFMDASRTAAVRNISVSGALNTYTVTLPFTPAYAGINFNNRLSDAITSEHKNLYATGYTTFTYGRATIGVNNIGTDSNLVRVEHNFVRPDAMKNNINNYRLNTQHYWKIDGILTPGFFANVKFYFDGRKAINHTPGSTPYLDTCLTRFTADSIILLYRKNAADDWKEVNGYTKVKLGVAASVYGYIIADTMRLGEYCFANGVSQYIGINEKEQRSGPRVYPNPASDHITINLEKAPVIPDQVTCRIYSIEGRKMYEQTFSGADFRVDVASFAKGMYTLSLDGDGLHYVQKLAIGGK
jgi:aminopeptidase N